MSQISLPGIEDLLPLIPLLKFFPLYLDTASEVTKATSVPFAGISGNQTACLLIGPTKLAIFLLTVNSQFSQTLHYIFFKDSSLPIFHYLSHGISL